MSSMTCHSGGTECRGSPYSSRSRHPEAERPKDPVNYCFCSTKCYWILPLRVRMTHFCSIVQGDASDCAVQDESNSDVVDAFAVPFWSRSAVSCSSSRGPKGRRIQSSFAFAVQDVTGSFTSFRMTHFCSIVQGDASDCAVQDESNSDVVDAFAVPFWSRSAVSCSSSRGPKGRRIQSSFAFAVQDVTGSFTSFRMTRPIVLFRTNSEVS